MEAVLSQSICTRCGKTRVVISTYKETVGTSVLTIVEAVCPDPDCQAHVDSLLAKDKAKRDELKDKEEKRKTSWEKRKKVETSSKKKN